MSSAAGEIDPEIGAGFLKRIMGGQLVFLVGEHLLGHEDRRILTNSGSYIPSQKNTTLNHFLRLIKVLNERVLERA